VVTIRMRPAHEAIADDADVEGFLCHLGLVDSGWLIVDRLTNRDAHLSKSE
jgi:hypothetical protein